MQSKHYIFVVLLILTMYGLYSSMYYRNLEKLIEDYNKYIANTYKGNNNDIDQNNEEILFTKTALKQYTNLNNGLYLSILGEVFDVTSGAKHYGPGASYNAFTGRDGSAAFITGDFTESGLTDDLSSLTDKQIQSLMTWVEFYKKTYIYKGKLIGRYYDESGYPTKERYMLEKKILLTEKINIDEELLSMKFPSCNVEWSADKGTRVWCSTKSGGVSRNWIGVPRMIFDDFKSKKHRCACIKIESQDFKDNQSIIKPYEGCAENARECILKDDV